jgi:glycosyltransferase involved in cell wall biosynthesis
MKIALTTQTYFPKVGGPSSYSYNLAKALKSLGHEVTIFTPTPTTKEDTDELEIIRLPENNSYMNKIKFFLKYPTLSQLLKTYAWNSFYQELSNVLKKEKYEAIISRGIWSHAAAYRQKEKITTAMVFGTQPYSSLHYVKKILMAHSFSEIDYKVAIWESLKEPLMLNWGIQINKIINNGIDSSLFYPSDDNDRDNFVIGAVSNFFYKHKVDGLKVLLKAFNKIAQKKEDIELILVGEGRYKENFINEIMKLDPKINKRIHLYDPFDYNKMPIFYNKIDLLAHISYQDAGPNAVLEAMSCAKPIMSNDVGIVTHTVNEHNGWIVNPTVNDVYKTLSKILDMDKSLLRKKGAFGRNIIEKRYSWENSAKEYIKMLNT